MDRDQKIKFIIDHVLPDPGDSGETFHQFLSRFTNRELDVAVRVHLLDQAGVLTPNDLIPLNRIFCKHGGDIQVEVTAKNERTGFGDELN